MVSRGQRVMLFLVFGVFFTVVFLVGGGVVSSSNGGYWTGIFGIGYAMGLVIAGPWVYRSARAMHLVDDRRALSARQYLIGSLIVGLMFACSLAFVRSDLLSSSPIQHAFMIGMGFCLAQFAPLGLGFLQTRNES